MIRRFCVRSPQNEPEVQCYADLHGMIYYRGLTGLGWALVISIDDEDHRYDDWLCLYGWAVWELEKPPQL